MVEVLGVLKRRVRGGGGELQLLALVLSLAVEVPVVCGLVWVSGRASRSRGGVGVDEGQSSAKCVAMNLRRVAAAAACGTLLTHPVVWWANTHGLVGVLSGSARLAALELGAVLVEGAVLVWLLPLRWWRGLGVSLLANGASFGLGWVLIRAWLFWR